MYEWLMKRASDYKTLWYVGAVVIVALIAWYYVFQSPLHGNVYATVIDDTGQHALTLQLPDLTRSTPLAPTGTATRLLAAVPNVSGTAFVVAAEGGARSLLLDTGTGYPAPIYTGVVEVPAWSPDGASIAFSVITSTSSVAVGDPDQWTVYRAVKNGDSLVVGNGYSPYPTLNQHTVALTSKGIALLSYSDTGPVIVVASPTFVPVSTPFTVSQDGLRVAWVAPADRSLQVFENVNGYFVPLLLSKDIQPQSMVFSPDGAYLLGTTHTEATTTLSLIQVSGGKVTPVGDTAGYLNLHVWHYE